MSNNLPLLNRYLEERKEMEKQNNSQTKPREFVCTDCKMLTPYSVKFLGWYEKNTPMNQLPKGKRSFKQVGLIFNKFSILYDWHIRGLEDHKCQPHDPIREDHFGLM